MVSSLKGWRDFRACEFSLLTFLMVFFFSLLFFHFFFLSSLLCDCLYLSLIHPTHDFPRTYT